MPVVQDLVLGLEINGIRNKRGLVPSIPRASGVQVEFFREAGQPLVQGNSFAILPITAVCQQLCQTSVIPACNANIASNFAPPPGFLSAHADDGVVGTQSCLKKPSPSYDPSSRQPGEISCDPRVSSKPDFSGLTPGSYQLCHRAPSSCSYYECWPVWKPTGIHVKVQDHVVALELRPGDSPRLPLL
jgi:hypothetical protein